MNEPVKPVSTPEFWRGRILTALATGKELHTIIYDTDYGNWQEIQSHTRSKFADLLVGGERILDAGCGYGALFETVPRIPRRSRRSRRSARAVEYMGVDISQDLIDLGRIRNPAADLQVGDLRSLSFSDQSFTYAVCRSIRGMIIDNLGLDEWQLIVKELLRVAKQLILIEYNDPGKWRIVNDPQDA